MRNRIGRRCTRNGVLAVALALVALAGVAGCGGSKTPHMGQAAELFRWDVDDTAAMRKLHSDVVSALYALNTDATGIAYGSDGRLRVMTAYLMRFDSDRTMPATDISGGKSVDWENPAWSPSPVGPSSPPAEPTSCGGAPTAPPRWWPTSRRTTARWAPPFRPPHRSEPSTPATTLSLPQTSSTQLITGISPLWREGTRAFRLKCSTESQPNVNTFKQAGSLQPS
jgi:hypothetical protein